MVLSIKDQVWYLIRADMWEENMQEPKKILMKTPFVLLMTTTSTSSATTMIYLQLP
jgi:hypothetical protein